MSDTEFLDAQVRSFVGRHPHFDGWKIYKCHDALGGKLHLNLLLDFIRDRHPGALADRHASNEVRTADMMGIASESHDVQSGSKWDRKFELDANDWHGVLHVDWQGEPIHYHRFSGRDLGGLQRITLVATKSNALLRSFHGRLGEYGKKRGRLLGRKIIVVNGEDIPIPRVSWDEVFLPAGMVSEIRTNVESFFNCRCRYKELNIPFRRGFLFAGAPGCGKTFTLKALASNTKAAFISVLTRAEIDENDIDHAFYLANKFAPSVLVLEDLDRLVGARGISVSHLLNVLDGLRAVEGVLTIATSNHPEKLDPALLHRPSRFDRVWRFPLPDMEERLELLKKVGGRRFQAAALREIARASGGFSMAYVQEIIVNALLKSAHYGCNPEPNDLVESLEVLRRQRKTASRSGEDLSEREELGFSVGKTPGRAYPVA